jgi:hypothetical protein
MEIKLNMKHKIFIPGFEFKGAWFPATRITSSLVTITSCVGLAVCVQICPGLHVLLSATHPCWRFSYRVEEPRVEAELAP